MDLKKYRKVLNITQKEVASGIGIKSSTYSNYEQGISFPDIETLKKISQFYRVSIDELVENNVGHFISEWQLSDIQKANFHLIQKLNNRNNLIANGMMLRLLQEQGVTE